MHLLRVRSEYWVAQVVGRWWHHPHLRRHRHTKTLFAAAFQQRSTGNRNLLLLNRNFLPLLSHNLSNSAFTFYFHSLGNVHRCFYKDGQNAFDGGILSLSPKWTHICYMTRHAFTFYFHCTKLSYKDGQNAYGGACWGLNKGSSSVVWLSGSSSPPA